ncbi:LOW QUALITY PROTEIN: hypothetical protein V1477_001626 [Vespula maculifrons]|uniref:Uncharacterized protein n=1 Tax=Vespula maculifrons TaxID=7453 RepID=A0ABD2CZS2_VESMC
MSDIIISEECVLRELRCVLFEIQGKTESVTVGPVILPPRNTPTTPFHSKTKQIVQNIERMSDITISEECVLRELRCVLFEIQGKTESVTVGPVILPPRNIEIMSDITISEECVLRELRCVLFEIQGKTESVTVGPVILPPRNTPTTPFHSKTKQIVQNIERMSDIIIYEECVLPELRCVLVEIRSKTEPLTIKIGRTFDFVVISRNPVSPLLNFILKPNKSYSILKE